MIGKAPRGIHKEVLRAKPSVDFLEESQENFPKELLKVFFQQFRYSQRNFSKEFLTYSYTYPFCGTLKDLSKVFPKVFHWNSSCESFWNFLKDSFWFFKVQTEIPTRISPGLHARIYQTLSTRNSSWEPFQNFWRISSRNCPTFWWIAPAHSECFPASLLYQS